MAKGNVVGVTVTPITGVCIHSAFRTAGDGTGERRPYGHVRRVTAAS